jgi:NADH-quinone oxidoreductase subunit G
VLRTVPRDNESVNECWLSDRDRYSHQGLYAEDRLAQPMVKRNGTWHEVAWDDAVSASVKALCDAGNDIGFLVHPATSNEEGELLRRLATGLGSAHLDHRLRQQDFADRPAARPFGTPVAELDTVGAALLIGSHVRHEMPLVGQRLRQAARHGASIHAVGCLALDQGYELDGEIVVPPQKLLAAVLSIARAAADASELSPPAGLAGALEGVVADEAAKAAFAALGNAGQAVVILGEMAATHPQASRLRAAAKYVAEAAQAGYNELPLGANAIGLAQTGVLPGEGGLDARAMLEQPRNAYVLYGVDLPYDVADGTAAQMSLAGADSVVAFSAYAGRTLRDIADVILPLALLPEIDATLSNVDGQAQRVKAGATAPGQARAGWRILRALGGELQLEGFSFDDFATLAQEVHASEPPVGEGLCEATASGEGMTRIASLPIYRTDAVLRRADALNAHPLTRGAAARLNADDAARMGVTDGDTVKVDSENALTVAVDDAVPAGAVWIESAYAATASLPPHGAVLTLSKA